ncbi:bifunctional transcriptional activator/DNA repair enzyme AdaA [Hyphococcus luteus]|uniref:HTH araC/xylS-type domain-containing protein n=1 Tax=Hyphococcus luteus TaxID=2058213 RepID=A0A2S7KBA9_9PROT|nr:Ada metal-binding domain-containing protein [Marinicaulis flavus]PQA89738.1 hypothetical protein CW354_02460 [Marinicaulis flavus]
MKAAVEDWRWQALVSRDPEADAAFRYAVEATGIYCRPTCTTPIPLQKNVRYFPDSTSAEAAGFAPCKRCRPALASSSTPQIESVLLACIHMHDCARPPAPAALADLVGMSRFRFPRVFKTTLGVTPHEYADELRWNRFSQYLTLGLPIAEAIYEAGFGAVSCVYERALHWMGMTPAIWRAGGAGAAIWYEVVERRQRNALIAGTDDGVCIIALDHSRMKLEDSLHSQFASASIRSADPDTAYWLANAVQRAELPEIVCSFPSHIREIGLAARLRKAVNNAILDGPLAPSAPFTFPPRDMASLLR